MTIPSEALRVIEPGQVAAWMRANGWHLAATRPEHTALYRKLVPGEGEYEVSLPLDAAFRDYTRRLGEVVDTLATATSRPPAWVISELRASTFDILRLRASGPGIGAGRIPVEAGTRLFAQTRDLLLAAACAVHDPRPAYPTRKPAEALDFLRRVKLAAPEEGSFVITVHAPIPPALQPALSDELDDPPFERRTTLMLATAVSAARQAAERAMLAGDAQAFLDGTPRGISANLCDALAGFFDGEETTARIDLHLGWAASRPVPASTPTALALTSDLAPVLSQGARLLRSRAPTPDFDLEGIVVGLESPNPSEGGTAIVSTYIDGQRRKVRVPMSPADYPLAIRAHESRALLRCEGELERQGRRFTLDHTRLVTLVEDED